ncbi:MAG: hypothetical protein ACK4RK_05700 [Gemmataceae bacterium]
MRLDRNHPVRVVLVVVGCWWAVALHAAPPTVTSITPSGVQRGQAVEVVVTGTNLTENAKLLLPFTAEQTLIPEDKPNPARVRFQLTVAKDVPVGVYPARLVTGDGVSSFVLFSVDAFPGINETEPNNTPEQAQKVPVPSVVNGQCAGGDIDFFRISAQKGQRLIIEVESARLGSGVLPMLRLTDARQRFVAADDTQRLMGDGRIVFTPAEDGDYLIEVADSRYKGGNPAPYRLKIADYDFCAEVFPLGGKRGETVTFTLRGGTLPQETRVQRPLRDAAETNGGFGGGTMPLDLDGVLRVGGLAPRVAVGELPERTWLQPADQPDAVLDVTPPLTINGRIHDKGTVNRFRFSVQPGQRFRVAVQAEPFGSDLDGVLRVIDQTGRQLALADDTTYPPLVQGQQASIAVDPVADVTVPDNVTSLMVELRDQRYRGGVNFGYRLTIEPAQPDFLLALLSSEVNVPRGGSETLLVPVMRRGYTGAITLTIPTVPPGFTVRGGHVPANVNQGLLTLTASKDADLSQGPLFLTVEGKSWDGTPEIQRRAAFPFVRSRDGAAAASTLTVTHFALALTSAEPFGVRGPDRLEVVKGYPATVPVTVNRGMNQMFPVDVTATPNPATPPRPPGFPLTLQPAAIAANATQTDIPMTVPINGPDGAFDLVVQGRARIDNQNWAVVSPAFPVIVLPPFTVELPPMARLELGPMVTLKGRIQRQAVFKEPVRLQVAGLPAGVTLAQQPAPVTGDEFQIVLNVNPKADIPPTATFTLTAAATISGANYAAQPVVVNVTK